MLNNLLKADLLSEIEFVNHGFFNRLDGMSSGSFESLNIGFERGDDDSLVLKNREKITEYFDIKLSNIIILNQIHSDNVHVIDSSNIDKYKFQNWENAKKHEGDAIITDQKGILIGLGTADCAPVILCDKDKKMIAVIHVGWRGAVSNIIENTISKMKELGCKQLVAAIGPCLQKRNFEVDEKFALTIDKKYLGSFSDKILFDMPLLILEKLMKCGVKTVSKMNVDTFSNEKFFSHRRQEGTCGVQFSGIIIKE